MNLIDVTQQFKTDDDCLAYLESMRWPDGIRCPVCGCDRISTITRKNGTVTRGKSAGEPRKNRRTRIYQCLEETCKQQFSATAGTIFNDSHLPLTKWFMALALIVDAKKSISAKQLQQHLGIGSYRTAWYMAHRIRKAMVNEGSAELTGIVEMDETYLGGKIHNRHWRRPEFNTKQVWSASRNAVDEFGSSMRPDAKIETLAKYLKEHVSADVDYIMTDELPAYPKALRLSGHDVEKHRTVNHSAEDLGRRQHHHQRNRIRFFTLQTWRDRQFPQDFDKASPSLPERVRDAVQCAESRRQVQSDTQSYARGRAYALCGVDFGEIAGTIFPAFP